MRTAVFKRDRRSVFNAKEYDRLTQDHAAKWLAADLGIGRGHVPKIAQKHGYLPLCRRLAATSAAGGYLFADLRAVQRTPQNLSSGPPRFPFDSDFSQRILLSKPL